MLSSPQFTFIGEHWSVRSIGSNPLGDLSRPFHSPQLRGDKSNSGTSQIQQYLNKIQVLSIPGLFLKILFTIYKYTIRLPPPVNVMCFTILSFINFEFSASASLLTFITALCHVLGINLLLTDRCFGDLNIGLSCQPY